MIFEFSQDEILSILAKFTGQPKQSILIIWEDENVYARVAVIDESKMSDVVMFLGGLVNG